MDKGQQTSWDYQQVFASHGIGQRAIFMFIEGALPFNGPLYPIHPDQN
jgi:hypothetical protein